MGDGEEDMAVGRTENNISSERRRDEGDITEEEEGCGNMILVGKGGTTTGMEGGEVTNLGPHLREETEMEGML